MPTREEKEHMRALARGSGSPAPGPAEAEEAQSSHGVIATTTLPKGRPPPPPVGYVKRSGPLIQHARDVKKTKRIEAKAAHAEAERDAARTALAVVSSVVKTGLTGLRTILGLPTLSPVITATRWMSTACFTRHASDGRASGADYTDPRLAAARLTSFSEAVQGQSFRNVANPKKEVPRASGVAHARAAGTEAPAGPVLRMLTYSHEFDSTSQRVRPLRLHTDGTRATTGGVPIHIMMQAGAFRVFLRNTPTEEYMYIPTAEPWICKPLVMIGTAADDVLEALLRRAPLKVSDVPAMFEVAGANDFVCVAWSMDRASENGRLMRWLFTFVSRSSRQMLRCTSSLAGATGLRWSRGARRKVRPRART